MCPENVSAASSVQRIARKHLRSFPVHEHNTVGLSEDRSSTQILLSDYFNGLSSHLFSPPDTQSRSHVPESIASLPRVLHRIARRCLFFYICLIPYFRRSISKIRFPFLSFCKHLSIKTKCSNSCSLQYCYIRNEITIIRLQFYTIIFYFNCASYVSDHPVDLNLF